MYNFGEMTIIPRRSISNSVRSRGRDNGVFKFDRNDHDIRLQGIIDQKRLNEFFDTIENEMQPLTDYTVKLKRSQLLFLPVFLFTIGLVIFCYAPYAVKQSYKIQRIQGKCFRKASDAVKKLANRYQFEAKGIQIIMKVEAQQYDYNSYGNRINSSFNKKSGRTRSRVDIIQTPTLKIVWNIKNIDRYYPQIVNINAKYQNQQLSQYYPTDKQYISQYNDAVTNPPAYHTIWNSDSKK